jgi:hypothetical protein
VLIYPSYANRAPGKKEILADCFCRPSVDNGT